MQMNLLRAVWACGAHPAALCQSWPAGCSSQAHPSRVARLSMHTKFIAELSSIEHHQAVIRRVPGTQCSWIS